MHRLSQLLQVALVVGGGAGGVGTLLLQRDMWVWHMPDLAYRFLAGAALGYVAAGLLALLRPSSAGSELIAASVLIYGIPLIIAVLLSHERIDWDAAITWAFLALVIPGVVISVAVLWAGRNHVSTASAPLGEPLRLLLGLVSAAATAVGGLVFVAPRHAGFIWPWADLKAWTPLDSRLIASMLLTVGLAALLVVWRDSRAAALVFLAMLWTYCVVSSVGLALHARDTPALRTDDVVYIVIFLTIALASAVLFAVGATRTRDWRTQSSDEGVMP